ncbi:MAG: hypothetical protein V3U06_11505, partial [Candidatus Binatia bacterium]
MTLSKLGMGLPVPNDPETGRSSRTQTLSYFRNYEKVKASPDHEHEPQTRRFSTMERISVPGPI